MSPHPTQPRRKGAGLAAFVAGAAILGFGAPAAGQELGGGTIQIELQLYDDDGDPRRVAEESEDLRRFLNLANCQCNEPFLAELTLVGAGENVPSEAVHVYVGQDCERFDDDRHSERCQRVRTIEDLRSLRSATPVEIGAGELMFPNQDACEETEERRWIYVMVEDPEEADPVPAEDLGLSIDTQPPPPVADPGLAPGENAAQLSWDLPDVRADDLYEYQVLCARADGDDGPEDFGASARYRTAADICGADVEFSPAPMSVREKTPLPLEGAPQQDGPDAGPGDGPDAAPPPDDGEELPDDLPDELRELDSSAICATETGATRTSIRVDDLENGVPYHVVLVGIDRARNPHPMDFGEVEPRPAVDFWDDYKDSGGPAEGGYCFVATAALGGYDSASVRVLREFRDDALAHTAMGRAFIAGYYEHGEGLARAVESHPVLRAAAGALLLPVVALAAAWNAAGPIGALALTAAMVLLVRGAIAGVRAARRRASAPRGSETGGGSSAAGRAAAAAAMALAIAIGGGRAEAQTDVPRMDEPVDPPGPPEIRWNAGLQAGGVFPAMDRDFDGEGPFETMFGSAPFLIGKFTLDHYFFHPGGQLGATGSLGYFSESARAFATNEDGDILIEDGEPVRSEGDTTRFRMVPLTAGAVYRYTQLDEHLGIPLVPYARASLAYYLWWVTQPDGSVAETDDTRARGGSFGVEGTVGIALRAERLDESAARNLQNEFGIEHAGFFAEASYARVDGFGRESSLPVGGLAFWGGLNFEF